MRFCDEWLLLPQRLAVHEPSATAVIADVHLGYSAARQRIGDAIPWRTVKEELQLLTAAARACEIRALIVAGDLFERGYDPILCRQFLDVLDRLVIRFVGLVPGNHDRGIEEADTDLPILADGYDLAGWRIWHGDQPVTDAKAVMGHWHPALRRQGRKVPCFLVRGSQLILPAFSLDAAGAHVVGDPRWKGWERYASFGGEEFNRQA